MDRIEDIISVIKDLTEEKETKKSNVVAIVITCVIVAVAVAAAIYAIYRFVQPKYIDGEEFEFDDDDMDDFFEDEEDDDETIGYTPIPPVSIDADKEEE